jgi:hypothetical protein
MGIATVAGNVGRGLLAGLVGTAAMTVSSTVEMKLRGRPASTAPADAAKKVLGIAKFDSDAAEARFSTGVHVAYGTGWGAVRGLLGGTRLSPLGATGAHFGSVWGTEQVMLPALGVAPPATQWGAKEVAIDAWHHVVYAVATGLAYGWLTRRAG